MQIILQTTLGQNPNSSKLLGRLYFSKHKHEAEYTETSCYLNVVGTAGFEPTAPCTQNRCATRLRHAPTVAGFKTLGRK